MLHVPPPPPRKDQGSRRRRRNSPLKRPYRRSRTLSCERLEDRTLLSISSPELTALDAMPALFVENQGQWADGSVKYALQGPASSVRLTDSGAEFTLFHRESSAPSDGSDPSTPPGDLPGQSNVITQSTHFSAAFDGANVVQPVGLNQAETVFNYFVGDETNWRSNVPAYPSVAYPALYDGVDLLVSGRPGGLKYEFHVAPGADYRQIQISYSGITGLSLDAAGALHVQTSLGELIDAAPRIYQEIDGQQVEVAGSFALVDADTYTFAVTGAFDPAQELIIDPDLLWSTYMGGTADDYASAITVDAAGNAYVIGGWTYSSAFPTTSGAYDTTYNGGGDTFVAKFDTTGTLVYSTFLGGGGWEVGYGIAVDAAGNAYVTGFTASSNFPTTAGAYDTTANGGWDTFVAKLSATGSSLLYSTYLGGSGEERGYSIAVDAAGNTYVTSYTTSSNFPTTAGAYDTTANGGYDAFVAKLNSTGSSLVYSTYLGGNGEDSGYNIALDAAGSAYVTGYTKSSNFPTTPGAYDTTYNGGASDGFVAKLDPTGSSLQYSTFLGGGGEDNSYRIWVDGSGNAYLTGMAGTASSAFPTTPGAYDTTYNGGSHDAFIAKLNSTGSTLLYSTYLGGSGDDYGQGIALDAAGNINVVLYTNSTDAPTTAGAFDTTANGGFDALVSKLDSAGATLLYSTYLGGSGADAANSIQSDAAGNVYLTGSTASNNLPVTPGAFDTTYNGWMDVFVAK